MDSNDFGDLVLMLLDDDLFWIPENGSESCGNFTSRTL